ncbi:hypothetical protein STEG23_024510, partial [Scotinomys teguina]
ERIKNFNWGGEYILKKYMNCIVAGRQTGYDERLAHVGYPVFMEFQKGYVREIAGVRVRTCVTIYGETVNRNSLRRNLPAGGRQMRRPVVAQVFSEDAGLHSQALYRLSAS